MKKQILALIIGLIFMGWAAPQGISETVSGESKSIGTEAGEKARDVKTQFEEVSQKVRESVQALNQRVQEEWRKFNAAYNKPAK